VIGAFAAAAATLALATVPLQQTVTRSDPGVTATTITIGGTVPLTGPAAAFGSVGRGADAYFRYVNAHGGVFGRKIVYRYLDDAYEPAKTVQLTQQLVEQDHVFAIFNTVGTEHALAIRAYLNDRKVPELFVGSGVSRIASEHAKYPWTMGYLPSFVGEGVVDGRRIAASNPRAKIAVLYEDSDFGKDMLNGLRRGLGGRGTIVATQSYEIADTSIDSQMARLKASGADTLMLFATPKFAIFGYIGANRLGWHPRIYVSSVAISPDIMKIARLNATPRTVDRSISIAFVKDPTSPAWRSDKAVKLYRSILARFMPYAKPLDVYNYYGMTVAYTMVDALRGAGRNPTRAALLRAATHLREVDPFLLPGISVRTSPSDYYPIEKARFVRYRNGQWSYIGKLVSARG
jgi:ABC-type branched-subunit amino acid transport system substrate-binding protein